MRITSVECFVLDRQFPFIRIATNEGIVGWGECFRRITAVNVAAVQEVLAPILLGRNPFETEDLHRLMLIAGQIGGPHGTLTPAIAGVDIALWDIKGRALGVPVYQLLGGKVRDRVRVYASSLRRDMTPLEEARRVASFAEQGYTAYKLHSAIPGAIDDPADQTVATVREVRAAVGEAFEILVDVNGAFSPHHAIAVGRRLEELGAFHFEEPVPSHDLEGLARVADALAIPIAAGEMQHTRYQFRDLILHGRVDILQPDIVKAGGFTEMVKIAALASAHNRPLTVHNIQPTLCTAAHLHFVAATPICVYAQEYNIEPVSIRDEYPVLKTPLEVRQGYLDVPQGPGLGVEVDEAAVRRWAEQ